jgi:hypothetical protein
MPPQTRCPMKLSGAIAAALVAGSALAFAGRDDRSRGGGRAGASSCGSMRSRRRARLGARARKVPTRDMPGFAVRMLAVVIPPLRMLAPDLGHRVDLRTDQARRVLGFAPRPAATTIVDCAASRIGPAA